VDENTITYALGVWDLMAFKRKSEVLLDDDELEGVEVSSVLISVKMSQEVLDEIDGISGFKVIVKKGEEGEIRVGVNPRHKLEDSAFTKIRKSIKDVVLVMKGKKKDPETSED